MFNNGSFLLSPSPEQPLWCGALGVRTTDFFCELAVCSWARHFPLWTSVPHLPEEGIGQFDPYGPLGLSHSKVLYFSEASTEH